MVNESVWVALIAALAGILTTYLTVRYKNQVTARREQGKPKDRMETIFDGYEALIKQLQTDNERKSKLIDSLQTIVDKQREEIQHSQEMIDALREELEDSRQRTTELETQLDRMKREFSAPPTPTIDTPK